MTYLQINWNRTFRGCVSSSTFNWYYYSTGLVSKRNLHRNKNDYHHHSRLANRSSYTPGLLNRPLSPQSQSRNVHSLTTIKPTRTRAFTTTRALSMASDEDYMAFLDKANKDPSEGYNTARTQSKSREFKATDEGVVIPAVIQEATRESFYVSDADEPFVPVYLAWDEGGKGLPDEEEFASLIHHPDPSKAEIEIQDPAEWDTQGQYKEVLDAVRKAGKGNDVRVYRVAKGGVKVEYWVVTTEGKGANAKLVGAKALAIES
ncbi:hypothetical protein F4810DRAFT_176437 [Camillea tinctor]|nr:hypothetical protein F4810DRAFT_176437 [Camillea tinctor]